MIVHRTVVFVYVFHVLSLTLSVYVVCWHLNVFLFKQKTSYEMRISDWSSDVCSSDLEDFKTPLLDNYIICAFALFLTVFLGLEFTVWQGYEYYKASFYIYDGVYGSTFYMTTGLHGLHVIIGTLFLIVCFFRLIDLHFIYNHHFGYERSEEHTSEIQ